MKKSLIVKLIYLILIILFLLYFYANLEDFKSLIQLNLFTITLIILLFIFSIYMNGQFNRIVIKPFGKNISRIEGFRVALISSVGNYFGPFLGGFGLRAAYLKRKVGLNYTDFVSTVYGFYILSFLISATIGLLSLLILMDSSNDRGYWLLISFFSIIIILLLTAVYSKRFKFVANITERILGNKVSIITKLSKSWQKIRNHNGLISGLLKISIVNIILVSFINYLEFTLLGINLGIGPLLLYTVLGGFSQLVSITPGALGIREGIYLFSASVMGVTSTEILAVALIDRTIQFIVMGIGWIVITLASKWAKKDFE